MSMLFSIVSAPHHITKLHLSKIAVTISTAAASHCLPACPPPTLQDVKKVIQLITQFSISCVALLRFCFAMMFCISSRTLFFFLSFLFQFLLYTSFTDKRWSSSRAIELFSSYCTFVIVVVVVVSVAIYQCFVKSFCICYVSFCVDDGRWRCCCCYYWQQTTDRTNDLST